MNWIALPALIALITNFVLILVARKKTSVQLRWYGLAFIFSLHNISEIVALNSSTFNISLDTAFRLYYACSLISLVFTLVYAGNKNQSLVHKTFIVIAVSSLTLLIYLLLATNNVVSDSIALGNYVTASRGPHYILFQVFSLSLCTMILFALIWNYVKPNNETEQVDALWTLIAIAPLMTITICALILMSLGIKANPLVFVPITSTLFLLVLLKSPGLKPDTRDPRSLIPFSSEYAATADLQAIKSDYYLEKITLPEAMERLEATLLQYKADKYKGNASQIARALGIPRSTLYNKASKHGVNWKENMTNE